MTVRIRDIEVICTAPEGINLLVARVNTTEPGLYGLGCGTFAYRHLAVKLLIEEYLRPLLTGRDVANIESLWHLLHHNGYWRNGPIENNAISGIDMALWDIKGKMAGMPVYQLLGGKVREGVPVYRHADGADSREILDNIDRLLARGIRHIRVQCGGYGGGGHGAAPASAPQGSPPGVYLDGKAYRRDTARLLEEVRAKYGFKADFCHDVHGRLHPRDAILFAQELEKFKLFFLEDAIPLERQEYLRELRAKVSTPIAQGELFNHPYEWRNLVSEGLIDFIRIHVSQIGGITPARKVQLFAEPFGIRTAWHGPGDMSPVAHAANIHLDVAAHNFGLQEWSGTEPPNFVIQEVKGPREALLDVFPGLPEFRNGHVYPNDRPGLGVDLVDSEAAKYPCASGVTLWTQTRLPDGTPHAP
jgi:mannonate dehydratase